MPLTGRKVVEWEDMGDEVDRTLVPVFLEERAALEASAQADCGGHCLHCGSDRVYLIERIGQVEVQTPHGPIVLKKQRCRCRSCDRSFSPSRAGLSGGASPTTIWNISGRSISCFRISSPWEPPTQRVGNLNRRGHWQIPTQCVGFCTLRMSAPEGVDRMVLLGFV